ncbi:hypothetical protein CRG98_046363 [Punica granatum]|uniref:Uncharacterized protein n=1 Tax=Punica granatum TaxID=22663 RepID=A0A2I0HNH8_PUNGR|nr:hypothetical protein CRG98_046363 [Punica granatum]
MTHSVVLADVLNCVKRRVRSRDGAWLRGVREKLALPRKVHRSSGHDTLLWREGEGRALSRSPTTLEVRASAALDLRSGSERAPSKVVVGRPFPHLSQQLIGEVKGCPGRRVACILWNRVIYGWGLPTQGCEFLEIERGSLVAGSVA